MRAARKNLSAISRDDGPTRQAGDPDRYAATFAGRAGIILFIGRDPAAQERLTAPLARGDFTAIRSLRGAPEEPHHTCWLAGEE